ncbi:hypothetical protein RND71_003617 [Anisodus tanguticus]|uniref:Uncharacterized protein n=1 Tax=Anisodus tanguticus TaxID=243964 RepID=A0AAE1VU97_9SOLA|nr:hypothetical protein RND71_003617 [Anisodus tanguticus]
MRNSKFSIKNLLRHKLGNLYVETKNKKIETERLARNYNEKKGRKKREDYTSVLAGIL